MTESAPQPLLTAERLSRYYGEHCAVRELSLALHRGEVLGFLGPNGAGKSTTMKMLAGVLAPNDGDVVIEGIDLTADPRAAKSRLGYLPEHPPLTRELTVDEFLDFCARLHRVPARDVRAARERVKARCGLNAVGRRLLGNLSKGFQQRVGIAQAIIHAPAVVILDEPTVGLDPIQIREIRALIRELGRDHAVILSTHILPEVQAVCERVVIIHAGRIVLDERVEALADRSGAGALRVGLRRAPPVAVLAALPGVSAVEALGADRFVLRHDGGDALVETLAARAVGDGWGLTELTPVGTSLEEVFVALTGGDAEAAA
ncbi:MAG: ATP-binding cassette domain-containing protein [Gammaproteobacteria bacterium]|nr:ATP-binding cassette domain-containing protein [Gammaproteobacteria bacterium]